MPPKKGEDAGTSKEDGQRASILSLLDDEEPDEVSISSQKVKKIKSLKYIRIVILSIIWLIFTVMMMITHEREINWTSTVVPINADGKIYPMQPPPLHDSITLVLRGAFTFKHTDMIGREIVPQFLQDTKTDESKYFLNVNVLLHKKDDKYTMISKQWRVNIVDSKNFDNADTLVRKAEFHLSEGHEFSLENEYFFKFVLENVEEPLPILVQSFPCTIPTTTSIVVSSLIIVGLYTLLFWDITSRAIIALLFCTLSVSFMGIYHIRPSLPDLPKYVEVDYILLLIGLTIIVGVFAETGGDVYLVVQVFRLSRGHIWPLLSVICIITALGAAFLGKLTIIVLVTLFLIRYCEIQQLNAANVLTCVMLFSNIGHMLTPSHYVKDSMLDNPIVVKSAHYLDKFWTYVLHMLIPVVLSAVATYIYLRLYFHSTKSMQIIEAPVVSRLKHAIRFWSHTAKSLGDYSEMEKAVQQNVRNKVDKLRERLRRLGKMPAPVEDFNATLERLKERHTIKSKPKLIMCVIILSLVLLMQITYSFGWHYLSNGFSCLLFSLILLALVNWHDFESLMTKMDWSTILLIACIMIITRAVAPLGLLDVMGDAIVKRICSIDKDSRLYMSIIILVCASAFGSAFFDSTYMCYAMAGKVIDLVNTSDIPLPIEPLFMCVILGVGFGSNVTLISSFANIICSGLTEKHDFKLYFWDFFKVGAVVMLFSVIISILYIIIYAVIFF